MNTYYLPPGSPAGRAFIRRPATMSPQFEKIVWCVRTLFVYSADECYPKLLTQLRWLVRKSSTPSKVDVQKIGG